MVNQSCVLSTRFTLLSPSLSNHTHTNKYLQTQYRCNNITWLLNTSMSLNIPNNFSLSSINQLCIKRLCILHRMLISQTILWLSQELVQCFLIIFKYSLQQVIHMASNHLSSIQAWISSENKYQNSLYIYLRMDRLRKCNLIQSLLTSRKTNKFLKL